MNRLFRKILSLTLSLMIASSVVTSTVVVNASSEDTATTTTIPAVPDIPDVLSELGVSKPTSQEDYSNVYDLSAGSVNITSDGTYLILGNGISTSNSITVSSNVKAYITIDNVAISAEQAMFCASQSKVELNIKGNNVLSSTGGGKAGLCIPDDGYINITSDSTSNLLNVTCGSYAAGIGTNNTQTSTPGDIYITGGSITAMGNWGAGIGGSQYGDVKNIVITDGNIDARHLDWRAAGIGGGDCSSVTGGIYITGGTIYAEAPGNGAGIGGGAGYGTSTIVKNIVITGGNITAIGGNEGAGIGGGSSTNTVGGIYITGGNIDAKGTYAAGIGCGNRTNINGNIYISNANVNAIGIGGGAGIGCGQNANLVGNIDIKNNSTVNAYAADGGYAIGLGSNSGSSAISSINIDKTSSVIAKASSSDRTYYSDVLNLEDRALLSFNFKNVLKDTELHLLNCDDGNVTNILIDKDTQSLSFLVNPNNQYKLISKDHYLFSSNDGSETATIFAAGSYNNIDISSELVKFKVTYIVADCSKVNFVTEPISSDVEFGTSVKDIINSYKVIDKDYRACFVIANNNGEETTINKYEDLDNVLITSDTKITLSYIKRANSEVRFKYNNGKADEIITVDIGATVKEPTAPEKNKYDFVGWYNDETEKQWNFNDGVKYDLVLSAKWQYNPNKIIVPEVPDTLKELGKEKPVSDDEYDESWNIEENAINITKNGVYLVYGFNNATGNDLTIAENVTAYVTIRNININRTGVAVKINKGSHITLNIEGNNTCAGVSGVWERYGYGIITPGNGYCVFTAKDKDQKLNATGSGYFNGYHGGIGSSMDSSDPPGNIYITNGNITCDQTTYGLSSISGSALGTSAAPLNNIVITGGKVNITNAGTGIGSGDGEITGGIYIKDAEITACGDNRPVESHAVIGSGNAPVGDIYIENSNLSLSSKGNTIAAAIGSCDSKDCGDIVIKKSNVKISEGNLMGIGSSGGKVGNITITDTQLDISTVGTAIGSTSPSPTCGDIVIDNCSGTLIAEKENTATVGGAYAGNIDIKSSELSLSAGRYMGLSDGEATTIGASSNGTIKNINIADTQITVLGGSEYIASVIGAGRAKSKVGNIKIDNSQIYLGDETNSVSVLSAVVGGGSGESSTGNITINNAEIQSYKSSVSIGVGACKSGTALGGATVGQININKSNINLSDVGCITVGAGENCKTDDIIISDTTITSKGYFGIGSYGTATTGNITITKSDLAMTTDITAIGNNGGSTKDIIIDKCNVKAYSGETTLGANNEKSVIGKVIISDDTEIQLYSKGSSAISKNVLDNTDAIPTMYQGTFAETFSEDKVVLFDNAITKSDILLPAGYKTFAVKSQPDTWNYVQVDDWYYKGYMTYPDESSDETMNYYTKKDIITKFRDLRPTEYSWIFFETDGNATIDPPSIKVISGGKLPYLPTITPNKGYKYSHWQYDYYTTYAVNLGYDHRGTLKNLNDILKWYFEFGDKTKITPSEDEISTLFAVDLNYDGDIVWGRLASEYNSFESKLGGKFVFTAIQEPLPYDYTVKYVDEDGKSIAPDKVGQGLYNTEITESPIYIPGYTPIDKSSKTFTISYNKNEITFVYKLGSSSRKLTVVVLEDETNLGVKATLDISNSDASITDKLTTDDNGYALTTSDYDIGDTINIDVSDLDEQYLPVDKIKYTVTSDNDILYIYVKKNDKFIITGYDNANDKYICLAVIAIVSFGLSLSIIKSSKKKRKK